MDPIKVKIPVGGDGIIPVVETEEAKAARIAAEEAANTAAAVSIETEEQKAAKLAKEAADKEATDKAIKDAVDSAKIAVVGEDGNSVEYTLSETGDAVDANGKVVYTAAQLAEFAADDDEPGVASIEDISKVSGITVTDDKGKPKIYENSIEGFAQREVDIKAIGYEEGVQKAISEFFASNPEFESMYNYKRTYGTLANYSDYVDYSKVTLAKDNEQQLIDVIVKAELAKGTSPERAMKLANFSKADGTLVADAEDSLKFLVKSQETDRNKAIQREQEAAAKALQDEYNYYGIGYDKDGKEVVLNVDNSVYDIVVNKGIIGNIMLPKDGITVKDTSGTAKHLTRRQVFDYIYTPVAEIDGELYSQAQIDEYKRLSSKDELIKTYVRNLLGGDVSQLVEVSKRKDNANTIRTFRAKVKQSAQGSGGGSKKVVIPVR